MKVNLRKPSFPFDIVITVESETELKALAKITDALHLEWNNDESMAARMINDSIS